jgi:hypothetical protein
MGSSRFAPPAAGRLAAPPPFDGRLFSAPCPRRAPMRRLLLAAAAVLAGARAAAGDVVISEVHYHPPPEDGNALEFVEVHNLGEASVSIAGWRLAEAIEFAFPEGTALAAGGRVVVARDREAFSARFRLPPSLVLGDFAGSLSDAGEALVLVDADDAYRDGIRFDDEAPWPIGADGGGLSLQRICAEDRSPGHRNWIALAPSPAAGHAGAICPLPPGPEPTVVINEVHYHPASSDADAPPGASSAGDEDALEFVELQNVSARAVDLGDHRLDGGIEFRFAAGTVMAPGAFLVVCRDREAIARRYGIDDALGDFAGRLANEGERVTLWDGQGRVVDSVRYEPSGDWPADADGGGSSLERVAAAFSGEDPANWTASRLPRGRYLRLARDGVRGQGFTLRLLLYLDGEGEALVDQVRLEEIGQEGTNLVENGGFDAGLEGWRFQGGAAASSWDPRGGIGDSGALRLRGAGPCPSGGCGVSGSASIAVALPPDNGRRYRLTVDVALVGGGGVFHAGLPQGVQVSSSAAPSETPGAPNRAAAAAPPPLPLHVRRFPQQPSPGAPVWIRALVRQPRPAAVRIDIESPSGRSEMALVDDGSQLDGGAGDGVYGVRLPAFPSGAAVRYRVVAEAAGQRAESPRARVPDAPGAGEWWGFHVAEPAETGGLPIYHLLIDGVEASDWRSLNAQLDCLNPAPAAFAYRGDLYPAVGVRFRGNASCAYPKRHLKVIFDSGRPFEGQERINLNGMWSDKSMLRERLAWDFIRDLGAPACDTRYVSVAVNGAFHGLYLQIQEPDGAFLESRGLDPGGDLYRIEFPDPVDAHAASDYERFWERETRQRRGLDELAGFIDAMHADGRAAAGPSLEFWQERGLAELAIAFQVSQVVLNNWDSLDFNYYLYHDQEDDRWGTLSWDLDLTFGKFAGGGAASLNDQMASDLGMDVDPWYMTTIHGSSRRNFFQDFFFRAGGGHFQRAYLVRLWDALEQAHRLEHYEPIVERLVAELLHEEERDRERWGRYPSNVPGFPDDMPSNASTLLRQIALHRSVLRGFIRRFHPEIPSHPRMQITEILYASDAGADEIEFVELLNTSSGEIDVSGWRLDGLRYEFPAASRIPAGGVIVVARSPDALRRRHPGLDSRLLFGPYEGRLDDEGESLHVLDAGPGHPATVDLVRYEPDGAWPVARGGRSIEWRRPAADRDNARASEWRVSPAPGGTPGRALPRFVRGDAGGDGAVTLADAVSILRYLFLGADPPRPLDAADADDSGKVDLTDAVRVLLFLHRDGAPPPSPFPAAGVDLTFDELADDT